MIQYWKTGNNLKDGIAWYWMFTSYSVEAPNYAGNVGYLHFKIFIINYCFHYEPLDR